MVIFFTQLGMPVKSMAVPDVVATAAVNVLWEYPDKVEFVTASRLSPVLPKMERKRGAYIKGSVVMKRATKEILEHLIQRHQDLKECQPAICTAAAMITAAYKKGNKLLLCVCYRQQMSGFL